MLFSIGGACWCASRSRTLPMLGSTSAFLAALKPGQRALFVLAHQTIVTGDIRRQHGRKPS
jgi:hypothetical protein